MISSLLTIGLSFVIGFSVFLSMPLIFHRKTGNLHVIFFNAIAIGILVFLLMDIFGDVVALFNGTINSLEVTYLLGFIAAFLFFVMPKGKREVIESPKRTSVLAALGIGFQNITEGLVFGSAGAVGLLSIYVISAIGFTLQNITEGFPIAGPLMGSKEKLEKRFVALAFLIGGVPTIIGTLIGLVYYSAAFIVFFDALASAVILYVVLVLFRVNISKSILSSGGEKGIRLTYIGILIGFVIGFLVNLPL